ncbi:MAG: hypothetical protein H6842_13320 [Rhodospirillaceae bacterium]|nr:hypothetical protein [Rhodospirillaceae bacterium]
MAPLVGLFAAAAVAGAGAAVGWRLVRDHLLPAVSGGRPKARRGGEGGQVIEGDYVDVTDRGASARTRRERGGD